MTQENKVAELMKARVKCIGTDDKHYPGSPFKIGEILLVDSAGDRSAIGLSRNERGESYWLIPKDYPHLFKKLEWWEDRKPEEMPGYVKMSADIKTSEIKISDILKVKEWINDGAGEIYFNFDGDRKGIGHYPYDFQPATYDQYIKQNL